MPALAVMWHARWVGVAPDVQVLEGCVDLQAVSEGSGSLTAQPIVGQVQDLQHLIALLRDSHHNAVINTATSGPEVASLLPPYQN